MTLCFFNAALARTDVRVIERTKSGKTIILNIGTLEGVESNEFGILTQGSSKVARGRAVKVFKNYSVWLLTHFYNNKLLISGGKYDLLGFSEQNYLEPQKKINDSLSVSSEGVNQFELAKIEGDHQEERFFDNVFDDGERRYLKKTASGKWIKSKTGKAYIRESDSGDSIDLIRRKEAIDKYENRVSNFLEKNAQQVDYDEFYKEQQKDKLTGVFQAKSSKSRNRYSEMLDKLKDKDIERVVVLEKLEKEVGLDWSDELSDEDLSDFLKAKGIVSEQIRQVSAISSDTSTQITLAVGTSFHDNRGVSSSNSSSMNYDLSLAGEFFCSRWSPSMSFLALEASYRHAYDKTVQDGVDGNILENSWMLGFNFYPFAKPTALRTNIVLVGVGHRQGSATLNYQGESVPLDYKSTPTLYGGLRFNAYSGFGFRILALYEPTTMIPTTISTGNIKYSNYKMNIGLSYIF